MKVAIIGASSLTGNKLIEILAKHPKAELAVATSQTFVGKPLGSLYLKKDLTFEAFEIEKVNECDVVFSCLPHGKSMEILPQILSEDKVVIDLGADFRTPADVFKKWYDEEHKAKEQAPATYGLSEVFTDEIKQSKFIANPGCYPTSVLLALAPLLNANIKLNNISIFSMSGRSGAGREKAIDYSRNKENAIQYKSVGHQHVGEMEYIGSSIGDNKLSILSFHPHVLTGLFKGMLTNILVHCVLDSEQKIVETYEKYYADQPFIELKKVDNETELSIKDVVSNDKDNNSCLLGLRYDEQKKVFYITSVIDNLMKGASGQAVQNMNLALGFEQTLGLKED